MAGKGKPKELSTAWWNVIRRKLYATRDTAWARMHVRCPDCDGPTHLMEGRYGRFYKCSRYECKGTSGAHLDGKPRPVNGTPQLHTARKRARVAIGAMFRQRDALHQEEHPDDVEDFWYPTTCSCGKEWRNVRPRLGDASPDLDFVVVEAGLLATTVLGARKARIDDLFGVRVSYKFGVHLRRRTVEECGRIEAAARGRTLWLVEERKLVRHRRRGNAWDRVYVGSFDEATG